MKITTKVTFRQYLKLLFGLTYQRPIMKVLVGIAIAVLLWVIGYYLGFSFLPEPVIYQYLTLILIVLVQPLVIFTTIRKTYRSSNHISERLVMDLLQDKIQINGNLFTWKCIGTRCSGLSKRRSGS